MSIVTRGRVVRGQDGPAVANAEPILRPGPSEAQRLRMSQEEVNAHQSADRIVDHALTRSRVVLEHARGEAERAVKEAVQKAAESEQARLAAAWLALRHAEESRTSRDLERAVALARLLAERLIGHAVTLDDEVVASLAKQALKEARGARTARIEAHPLDAASLRATLAKSGLGGTEGIQLEIIEDESLARGSLRVHTDLGTLDARLNPRLERLAAALRDALQPA